MGDRLEVGARLSMNSDEYVRGSKRAQKETKKLDKEINKSGKTNKKTGDEFTRLSKKTDKAGRSSSKTGKSFSGLDKQSKALSVSVASLARYLGPAVLGAALVSSVRKAAEFEKKMSEVSTLLDDTSSLNGITQSVREMAIEFGSDAPAQASAMYQIISAGAEDAAEANEILAASNKLAIGGITEIGIAADGLTSILNAYGDKVESATSVSDAMFVAMKAGKTTIGELSSSIGSVAPLAATLGIEFDELLAAVSALTLGGVSTSESITGLKGVLVAITSPTAEATKLAKDLKFEFTAQALKAQGLAGFLDKVKEATGGNVDQMAILFGRVEGLTKVLQLSGEQAEAFTEIQEKLKNKLGESEKAFTKMTDVFDFQWGVLIANFNDIGISIGDGVLPPLTEAVIAFNELFELLRSEASTSEKVSGWMNSMALGVDDFADRLGLVGEPLNGFAKLLQLVTTSSKLTLAQQKELDRQFAEGEKSFKGLRTEAEWLDKQFEDAVQTIDDLGDSISESKKASDELALSKKLLAAASREAAEAAKEEDKEWADFAKSLKSQTDADFKSRLSTIAYTKSMQDQIQVLKVRASQGETAAKVEEDWIQAKADNINVSREQITAYYDEIGALEDMLDKTDAAAGQWGKIWDNAVENMQRQGSDLWYGLFFEDPIESWSDFTDTALEAFKRMLAEMVNAWFVSGIIGLLNGDGVSGFSVGKLLGGGTGGSLANGASLLGAAGGIAGSTGSAIGAAGGAGLYAASGLAADSYLGASVAYGAGDVAAGVSGLTYGSTSAATGTLAAPEIGTGFSEAFAGSSGGGGVSGIGAGLQTVAAWAPVAAVAYLAFSGVMKSARIDKENAKLTDEFNRLRLETNAFAGEGVKVSDTLNIIGNEAGALYLRMTENEDGLFPDVTTFYDQLQAVGAEFRYIYDETGEAIAMVTGNIEEAQAIIEQGFDNAQLSFTAFQGGMESGITGLTAKVQGDTSKWSSFLQSALESGKLSANASFRFIEDDSGNTFLKMRGQAGEWASYLSSQGRVAADSFAGSMRYMFSEGDNMFGNLTSQALSFQNIINSIKGPNISGSFNASASGAAFNGPYKTGLDRVPYDNYPAIIDKDEAVLTAPEADLWRAGKQRGTANNVSINSGNDSRAVVVELQAVRDQLAQTNAGLAALQAAVYANAEIVSDRNEDALKEALNNPGQLRPAA